MDSPNHPDYNQDSNSNFSVSNIAPLVKRQTTKKIQQVACNPEQKIEELGYQIVQQLSIITPLEIHPNKICSEVEIYYYQRKLPSVMEQQLRKRQQKEKLDFIMAITSLFKKSFANTLNKFAILLPTGGIVYFFMEDIQDLPKLIIATHNFDFSYNLEKEGIKFRQLRKRQYEKQRVMVEGQYIRLFFGYFLNWVLAKNINIEIYSNFVFDFAFRDVPMIMKLNENRNEYEHLYYKEENYLGQKLSKLYLIKFQSLWFKEDIRKVQQKLREEESKRCKQAKVQRIQHQYEFKINKFTAELSVSQVQKPQQKIQSQ